MASEVEDVQEQDQASAFDVKAELEETHRALRETTLMIEQSQGEVSKLTQRNAAITSHLQQVQNQISESSVEEIRMAYDSALDAQQRLFVMRGQLEKLQSDKAHYERYKAALEIVENGGVSGTSASSSKVPNAKTGSLANVEMLVNAQEAERQRLSRQMHDGPAQALSNFILQTEIAMRLLDVDPPLRQEIVISRGPSTGYIAFPIGVETFGNCTQVLESRWNTVINISMSGITVNGNEYAPQLSWSFKYHPLIEMDGGIISPSVNYASPAGIPIDYQPPPPVRVTSTGQPDSSYWEQMALYIWGYVTDP